MVFGLGMTSVICGALAAILWIPATWAWWVAIFGILSGMTGTIAGFLSHAALRDRLPYMQQQAAAYGQPFRKPFDWGQLGFVISVTALAVTVLLFGQAFALVAVSHI